MNSIQQKIYLQLRQFGLDPRDWKLARVFRNGSRANRPAYSLQLVHRQEQEFKLIGAMADGDLFSLELA